MVTWRLCQARAVLLLPCCRLLEALGHVPANSKDFQNLALGITALLLRF